MAKTVKKVSPKLKDIPEKLRKNIERGHVPMSIHEPAKHSGLPLELEVSSEPAKKRAKKVKHRADRHEGHNQEKQGDE